MEQDLEADQDGGQDGVGGYSGQNAAAAVTIARRKMIVDL
jgi:hypothetical protein